MNKQTTNAPADGGPVERRVRPTVAYCPYCGSDAVKHVKGVPRCGSCRAVFFVDFSRYTRRSSAPPKCHGRDECEAPSVCKSAGVCMRA